MDHAIELIAKCHENVTVPKKKWTFLLNMSYFPVWKSTLKMTGGTIAVWMTRRLACFLTGRYYTDTNHLELHQY